MYEIKSFTEIEDKEKFINDFSSLPENLQQFPERTLPPTQYWKFLITQLSSIKKELFLAYDGENIIGRVSANTYTPDPSLGFWGCLEFDIKHPQVRFLLLKHANNWLKQQKVKRSVGPINFSTWFNYRYKTKVTTHSFDWEPTTPNHYYQTLDKEGYEIDKSFISALYKSFYPLHEYTKKHYQKTLESGYTFSHVDSSDEKNIDEIFSLTLHSFKQSYLYENISEGQFKGIFLNFIKNQNAEYIFTIHSPEDKKVGIVYAFSDQDFLVVKTIAISPEFQKLNLGNALLHHCFSAAKKDGLSKLVAAMVREGNNSLKFLEHLDQLIDKNEYHLLGKNLSL